MIQEIARIVIKAGSEALFEAGVKEAIPLFLRAKGCHGVRLAKSIEQPLHYTLIVNWETVEHHMVDFRQSDDFQTWRSLVGTHFDEAPVVGHTTDVLNSQQG